MCSVYTNPDRVLAMTAKTGSVRIDSRVDRVTIWAAVSTSRLNIWANMAVTPAVGQSDSTTQAL